MNICLISLANFVAGLIGRKKDLDKLLWVFGNLGGDEGEIPEWIEHDFELMKMLETIEKKNLGDNILAKYELEVRELRYESVKCKTAFDEGRAMGLKDTKALILNDETSNVIKDGISKLNFVYISIQSFDR